MSNVKNKVIPIENIISESFGKYAKYIIQDRALPDARDGLKPVQRRIIYAMNELGLYSNLPHKKSARTVGEVIGKYHPHGDSSIYEAMVRLSQEWKNNICLLDMHGNKGSIDGDSPAAMRYTECRLSSFGQLMVENIDKNTVKFIENFDGSEQEPTVLPTLFPTLLINGCTGIAAGYATNIPPFNAHEVINAVIAKIDSPNCRLDKILSLMPAPDFPTGGIIVDLSGVADAYTTGRGKITIRADIKKVNSKQIVITSIPYDTNKADIVKSIDLAKEKVESLNIVEVRDESDASGVSIVIETRPGANFEFIKNYLYKNTKLQTAYHLNMVVIKNRKPVLIDIFNCLQVFIDHAEQIIKKSSEFDLDKCLARKEIIEGLIKATSIIDDVVSVIRKAKDKADAMLQLQEIFSFTPNQAESIANLRLYRLTNSNVEELKKQLEELKVDIITLTNLVQNIDTRYLFLKNKLREFKKTYRYERKSQLSYDQTKITVDEMDLIEDKNLIFTFTSGGYMKNFSNRIWLAKDPKENFIKEDDLITNQYVANLRDRSLLFTSDANVLVVPNNKIASCKFKDMGTHVNSIVTIDSNVKIVNVINASYKNATNATQVIICNASGYIKRCELNDMISKRANIISCGKLDEHDQVVSAFVIDNEEQKIIIASTRGYINSYSANQIPLVSRNSKGVKAMGLKEGDTIANCIACSESTQQVAIVTNYAIKRVNLTEIPFGNRTNLGKLLSLFISSHNEIKVIKILPLQQNTKLVFVNNKQVKEYASGSEINYLVYDQRIYSANNDIVDCNIWSEKIQNQDLANE